MKLDSSPGWPSRCLRERAPVRRDSGRVRDHLAERRRRQLEARACIRRPMSDHKDRNGLEDVAPGAGRVAGRDGTRRSSTRRTTRRWPAGIRPASKRRIRPRCRNRSRRGTGTAARGAREESRGNREVNRHGRYATAGRPDARGPARSSAHTVIAKAPKTFSSQAAGELLSVATTVLSGTSRISLEQSSMPTILHAN